MSAARLARIVAPVPSASRMNIVLWILQIVLAVVFAGAGALKLAKSKEELLPSLPALAPYRPITIKAIAAAEVLGALGLVVAPLVGLDDVVPWAALGVGSVMVAGAIAHGEIGEWSKIGLNAVLLVLAVTVMVGRSAHLPL